MKLAEALKLLGSILIYVHSRAETTHTVYFVGTVGIQEWRSLALG
jgi:hypothetical protein